LLLKLTARVQFPALVLHLAFNFCEDFFQLYRRLGISTSPYIDVLVPKNSQNPRSNPDPFNSVDIELSAPANRFSSLTSWAAGERGSSSVELRCMVGQCESNWSIVRGGLGGFIDGLERVECALLDGINLKARW
jgi:hypothetical protein